MFDMMRDVIGKLSFTIGTVLGTSSWIGVLKLSDLTEILTIVSLLVAIIYYVMRIYQQRLETRKFKRKNKDKENDEI